MAGNNFLSAPPIFTGENYQIWAVKMESYLQAFDLWDLVEADPEDPIIAQIRSNKQERNKRCRAKTCIYSVVLDNIYKDHDMRNNKTSMGSFERRILGKHQDKVDAGS